ncbi:MAG: hypothetical protein DRI30_01240 [Chloroflexi bacterium]|nr:MAG: hypothetical protein DRI30_01240 [Chloroflexota bacterium]
MPNRPDRIQKEVDELLANIEKFPPRRPRSRRISDAASAPFRALRRSLSGLSLPRMSAGHVLLAAIIIIVIARVAGDASSLWNWVIVGGIALFIAAFVMSLRRQSKPPAERYWRDRPLDLDDRGSRRSFWDRWRGR